MIEKREIEYEAVLGIIKTDVWLTKIMLVVFSVVALVVKILFGVPRSWLISFLLLGWILFYLPYNFFLKRTKTAQELCNVYFKYCLFDVLLLTSVIHFLAGAEWIGVIFYTIPLLMSCFVLPKQKTLILAFFTSFCYVSLLVLEYSGVIPHEPMFLLRPGLYRSTAYVGTQIVVVAALFYFVVDTASTFSGTLREKRQELISEREKTSQALKQAEETKEVLEIRVRARTSELEELARTREETVKERTEELQKKVEELERFQKLIVGRELKMIELKKEISKLKKQLKPRS